MSDDFVGAGPLFGGPDEDLPERRGRPREHPEAEVAEKVAVLTAAGRTQEEIAGALVIDPKTLRKHYSRQLKRGPVLVEAYLDLQVFEQAKAGKLAAIKMAKAQLVEAKAIRASDKIARRQARSASPVPRGAGVKLGKKEELQAAAERVTGRFAPPAMPRLVVSNP